MCKGSIAFFILFFNEHAQIINTKLRIRFVYIFRLSTVTSLSCSHTPSLFVWFTFFLYILFYMWHNISIIYKYVVHECFLILHTHTHTPPRLYNSSSFYFYLDSDLLYFISLSYYLFLHMLPHLFHHRK